MRYREALQVQLQERYRRLYKAASGAFHSEVGYFETFIRSTPALSAIVARLEVGEPDIDPDSWVAEHCTWQVFEMPPTEDGRAKVSWHLIQQWKEDRHSAAMFGHNISRENDLEAGCRTATEQIIEPFVEYLQRALGTASDLLYLLERYVRRLEWFEKERLWGSYLADTSRGEALYDSDLRRFLFDQGVDFPFSQPKSASGQADVIDLARDEPLVCEIKLFDGDRYSKSYIAKGFRQALQYARDYGQTSAFLVIVDLSELDLRLPTDGAAGDWPPRVESSDVTVYMVRARARLMPSASQQSALRAVTVSKDDLFSEVPDAAE